MNQTSKVGMAVAGGYLLGRTKKAKTALALGMWLAGHKMRTRPSWLVADAVTKLAGSPDGKQLRDQLSREVMGRGKRVVGGLLSERLERLADGISDRAELIASGGSQNGHARGRERDEADQDYAAEEDFEEDDEYEDEESEPQDEYEEEEESEPQDEYEEDEESEPQDEYEDEYEDDEAEDDEAEDGEAEDGESEPQDEYENEYEDEAEDEDEGERQPVGAGSSRGRSGRSRR